MKYAFISGIPTAGKSYLAKKVAQETNSIHVDLDKLRGQMKKYPELEPWVNFFWYKNEKEYWDSVTPEEHWDNMKKQSEKLWPFILKRICEVQKAGKPAIFEGVNILPHLAHKDLDFPGVILLGESEQAVFDRCREDPRWGETEELQKLEAEWFYIHEGKKYEEEAKKYGFKAFHNNTEAEEELIRLLK